MNRLVASFFSLALVLGFGCAKPNLEVLHTLRPLVAEGGGSAPALALEVMPFHLPDALLRPQLLTESEGGSLRLLENHRWANSLDRDLQRVLTENLSRLLGANAVVAFPYGDRIQAAYRLEVDVHRLAGRPGGTLALQATWMLCPLQKGPALRVKKISLDRPVAGTDAEALVAAHSALLADLSRAIAGELGNLPGANR